MAKSHPTNYGEPFNERTFAVPQIPNALLLCKDMSDGILRFLSTCTVENVHESKHHDGDSVWQPIASDTRTYYMTAMDGEEIKLITLGSIEFTSPEKP